MDGGVIVLLLAYPVLILANALWVFLRVRAGEEATSEVERKERR